MHTQLIQRVMLASPDRFHTIQRPSAEGRGSTGILEETEEEMRRTRAKGRSNELWALIGALGARVEKAGASAGAGGEWAVVDEGLAQIAQILAEQQAALQHLMSICRRI